MNDVKNLSYSLLNQKEIDVLVDFLTDQKTSLNSEVMNQKSIDKLIALITGDESRIVTDVFNPFSSVDLQFLEDIGFRNSTEVCELRCDVDSDTGYLLLNAVNITTGKVLPVTPKLISSDDIEEWGYCISPTFFNRIAKVFNFKYTRDTHDKICNIYAKHTYGDENHKLSNLSLPENQNLLECLL